MRDPNPRFSASFRLVLASLIGMVAGQVALADYEELATEPAAPTPAPEVVVAPTSPPEAAAAPLTGPQVYRAVCIACHMPPGVGGAPPFGDKAAWTARIAQGMDTLIDPALNGFTGSTGMMPKKGERLDLSDAEIIGAVEYMVEQVAQ